MTGKKPVLLHDEDGVFLSNGAMELRADFTHMLARMRPENLKRELMLRAAGIRNGRAELTVVDAAAGLGEDALLFAAAGCTVRMYEYDPVIAALLEDDFVARRVEQVPRLVLGRGGRTRHGEHAWSRHRVQPPHRAEGASGKATE